MADNSSSLTIAHVTRREDYRPPDWLVPEIALDFDLDAASTRVHATLSVTRNGDHDQPLKLDGDGLLPLEIRVDGAVLATNQWSMEGGTLVIALSGPSHIVETFVEIAPGQQQADGALRQRRPALHPM